MLVNRKNDGVLSYEPSMPPSYLNLPAGLRSNRSFTLFFGGHTNKNVAGEVTRLETTAWPGVPN